MQQKNSQQNNINRNEPRPYPEPYEPEEEVSLLDYLVIITSNMKLILITTGVFLFLGLFIALTSTPEYTSSAQVVREIPGEGAGGSPLSALRGMGIQIGGASTGLTPETIPDILKSREVCLAVANDKYYFEDADSTMSYIEYLSREPGLFSVIFGFIKKYTIGLPRTVLGLLTPTKEIDESVVKKDGKLRILTEEEEAAIKSLRDIVKVDVNRESGIMDISVTTSDPILSASYCGNFIENLTRRVQEIYTQKTKENLVFIEDRFAETREELIQAEDELAKFIDSHENPTEARLTVEIDRLRRIVRFKSRLYEELQTQLTQAEIELQKTEPVLTVIDQPIPPREKSGPNRKLTVLLSIFLGGGLALGIVFIKEYVNNLKQDEENKSKLAKISQKFQPLKTKTLNIINRIRPKK